MTIAALAARFGVAPQTVHNWLVAAGVPRRPSPATVRRDISDDEIVRLYVDGCLSAAEVAEQLGCSARLVYVRLARRVCPVVIAGRDAAGGLLIRSSRTSTGRAG